MGMFDEAAKKRASDSEALASSLTSNKPTVSKPIPNTSQSNLTKITLSISEADRDKVKVYAALHRTSVSQLLHKWINDLEIPSFD